MLSPSSRGINLPEDPSSPFSPGTMPMTPPRTHEQVAEMMASVSLQASTLRELFPYGDHANPANPHLPASVALFRFDLRPSVCCLFGNALFGDVGYNARTRFPDAHMCRWNECC